MYLLLLLLLKFELTATTSVVVILIWWFDFWIRQYLCILSTICPALMIVRTFIVLVKVAQLLLLKVRRELT